MFRPILGAMAVMACMASFSPDALAASAVEDPEGSNQFILVPDAGGVERPNQTIKIECIECSLRSPDPFLNNVTPDQEAAFLGVDKDGVFKIEQKNAAIGVQYTLGPTQGIVVKQADTSFFLVNTGLSSFVKVKLLEGSVLFSHLAYTPIPAGIILLFTALAGVLGLKRYAAKRSEQESRSAGEFVPA